MDDQQNLDSKSLKDRAWTTDEIRKHSSNWTLAGDVGLFNLLNEFSHEIISRTHEVENAVDSLVHQTKMTSAQINNVINDFHMLSNIQFVENRVYDEELQESVTENKPPVEKTKEQREAEMLPKIMQAVELGLAVLDTAFDRINVNEISDSEDEEDISSEGHTILEPKDPYANRPLPYIIGSEEFMKCDYAGLKDLIEDDALSYSEESSISETDETSSDEGEPLPLDDDKFSEKPNDEMSLNISDKLSSSDESELFGSEKETNGFGSDTSLEFKSKEKNIQRTVVENQPVKESRQNSVSSLQSKLKLPQVLPVPKLQEKKEDDDLFAKDDISDDESPFSKKTGLFSSDVRFGDEKEDDLFGGDLFGKSPIEKVKEIKTEAPKAAIKKLPSPTVQETRKGTLFDNDEDSEDDIFNTLIKTKKPSTTKTSNAGSQDSSEKAETSSTPSSAPSTKPSGNAFDFVTGGGNTDSLFADDSDGDDLFSSKKTQSKKFEFDSSENDDLFGIISSKTPKETKVSSETKSSLFEDSKEFDQPIKKVPEKSVLTKKKTKDSLFEDSDSSDQEKQIPVKPQLSAPVKSKKEINLFGDDDLDDDIFSQVSQKKPEVKKETKKLSLFDDEPKPVTIKSTDVKPAAAVEKTKPLSLFEDTDEPISKEIKTAKPVEKPRSSSLFDDLEEDVPKIIASVPKLQQNKSSLFEDSDNFDLFAPKPAVKQVEPSVPVNVPKPTVGTRDEIDGFSSPKVKPTIEVKDKIDGISSSKVSSVPVIESGDNQASFDTPVDSSNVLSVINKGRVKVAAKRRKPTRQGRLAALESSDKETKSDVGTVPVHSNVNESDDLDNLFSTSVTKTATKPESPKLDYKAQEKKKMNLMSQLMSEVATSKIAQRKVVEEDDDDDVDIFSEAAKRDRSKSSFSFRPPEENGIASMFPIEKQEKSENLDVSKSDSFEDDFFTEPAFQNFRSSISHKDPPVLQLDDDDDDDDDLFSAIKSTVLPKAQPEASDSNDLFDDETDIFADAQKEKYEMFPNQIYDDEDDDIFSNVNSTISSKSSNNTVSKTNSSVKKVETQQVNAFDDPLTGLLGED